MPTIKELPHASTEAPSSSWGSMFSALGSLSKKVLSPRNLFLALSVIYLARLPRVAAGTTPELVFQDGPPPNQPPLCDIEEVACSEWHANAANSTYRFWHEISGIGNESPRKPLGCVNSANPPEMVNEAIRLIGLDGESRQCDLHAAAHDLTTQFTMEGGLEGPGLQKAMCILVQQSLQERLHECANANTAYFLFGMLSGVLSLLVAALPCVSSQRICGKRSRDTEGQEQALMDGGRGGVSPP